MIECQYCGNIFKTNGNLVTHIKTNKKCLRKRGILPENDFKCILCSKRFNTKPNLICHLKNCISKVSLNVFIEIEEKQKNEIEVRDQYIRDLEEKIEMLNTKFLEIASIPNTITNTNNTNNNTNNTIINQKNYLNLNDNNRMKEVLNQLKPEDIAGGQIGFAKFIFTTFLSTPDGEIIYKCVDTSRQNFSFINEHGDKDKDVKCNKLTNAIVKNNISCLALQKGEKLWAESGKINNDRRNYFQEKVLEVVSIDQDNAKFVSEITKLTA